MASFACGLASPGLLRAAPLFSESFDSQAGAKVVERRLSDAVVTYVDYSSFVRNEPGGEAAVTLSIPEAPNRIPGSAATRGVLLNCRYATTSRTATLMAATATGGPEMSFTGDYKVTFDLWLNADPLGSSGTTEGALFGIGQTVDGVISYTGRNSGTGTFGWLSTDGGVGTSGDIGFYSGAASGGNGIALDDSSSGAFFGAAFGQGLPLASRAAVKNIPNGQWVQVEILAVSGQASLFMNGMKAAWIDTAPTEGFAAVGYQDFFTGSGPTIGAGGPAVRNRQFALFDNLVVEPLPGAPSLEPAVSTVFAPVTAEGVLSNAAFTVMNNGAETYNITSASIDGVNAGDFSLLTTLPQPVTAGGAVFVEAGFNPSTPNGLKVARLVLNTDDPNLPVMHLPLQARRAITTISAPATVRAGSVSTIGGTATGEVQVTNNSTETVTLNSLTVTGPDAAMFSVPDTFPITMEAGSVVTLTANFAPTGAIGKKSAVLEISTTDPSVPELSVNIAARYGFGPPLLAHYKFDETSGTTLVDSSGAGSGGRYEVRELPFGFGQMSLLPGGAGSSVRLTPADSNTTGNFAVSNAAHLPDVSYSLWIRPEPKGGGNRRILHRSSLFTTVGTLYSLYITPAGSLAFDVNSQPAAATPEGVIADDTTYHVVVTHRDGNGFGNGNDTTGTRTRLYLDGELAGESVEPVAGYTDYQLTTSAEGLYIGTATSSGQGYVGLIDDLQVYSYELQPEEAAGLFREPGKTADQLTPPAFGISSFLYNAAEGTVTLTWLSETGVTYTVQSATDPAAFTDLTAHSNIVAEGPSTTRQISGISGGRHFFRVRKVVAP